MVRVHLRQFEVSATKTVDAMEYLLARLPALQSALDAEDYEALDLWWADSEETVLALEPVVAQLDAAEAGIEAELPGGPGLSGMADDTGNHTGVRGVIRKLWSFIPDLIDVSEKARQAARDRIKASGEKLDAIGSNDAEAEQAAAAAEADAKRRQKEAAAEAAVLVAKEVAGKLAPKGPVGKLVVKKAMEAGCKVIFGQTPCEPATPDGTCPTGLETAEGDSIELPVGINSVAVQCPGKARQRIDDVVIEEGKEAVVTREPVPIEQATPENVTRGDEPAQPPADDSGAAWLTCTRQSSSTDYYACVEVVGGRDAWMGLSTSDKTALCSNAGYTSWRGDWVAGVSADPEADCRANCEELSKSGGQYYVCDTPPE